MSQLTQSEKQKITSFLRAKYQEGQFKDKNEFRKEAQRSLGVKETRAREIVNQIIEAIGDKFTVVKKKEPKGQTQELNVTTSVSSLEDVIKVCNIDTTKWNVEKYSIEQGANDKEGNAQFRWKLALERKTADIADSYLDIFIKKTESFAPKKFVFTKSSTQKDCLYILNIQDLHVGKLVQDAMSGWGDYDTKIAVNLYNEAVDELLAKMPQDRVERVMLIVGSDLIHYENNRNQTTSGTQIEGDSRWQKNFEICCDLMTNTIEKIASRYITEVQVVPGNHAELSEYALGCYIKAFFRNHDNVIVHNEPSNRKYYGYGKNLIGFCHGDNIDVKKSDDLPLVMFRENQSEISKYKHLFWLSGHLHQDMQMDKKGVRVFIAPALCAADQYHSKKNYVGTIRTSQAMLFNKENGLEAIYYSKSIES